MERSGQVEALVDSPVGGALFVAAHQQHLGVDDLADPATVSALAAIVTAGALDPWSGELAQVRRWVAAEVAPLRPTVEAVAADPRNAWWWAPLDHDHQIALTESGVAPGVTEAVGPGDGWQVHAQRRTADGLETSTELVGGPADGRAVGPGAGIRSGLHALLAADATDWYPEYPLRQTRLHVAADARVWEITCPADWHRLARAHGDPATDRQTHPGLLDSAGSEHGPGPVWSAVAADWDAVHLTFGGFLTSLYVPVTTGGVTTTLWTWDGERTLWLRDVATARDALPDVPDRPDRGGLEDLRVPHRSGDGELRATRPPG